MEQPVESSKFRVVQAWHQALNAGDVETLVALSTEDVEVGGPRGASRGVAVLREWVARAGIRLEPGRVFQRGEVVVVEQTAEWREPGTGRIVGQQNLASLFVVRNGLVSRVIRYPDLATALREAGDALRELDPPGREK
ncbi:MAG TPA: nuclear transport factor 2 family protein [Chloroflexota bacterium]|nr:nuclear transport factor 2 family protein [Chloroflexota bacterium]